MLMLGNILLSMFVSCREGSIIAYRPKLLQFNHTHRYSFISKGSTLYSISFDGYHREILSYSGQVLQEFPV